VTRRALPRSITAVVLFAVCSWAATGCPRPDDGVEVASLPEQARDDYEVFAQRCSKCHSLARPLDSGITDDGFWHEYVERMRRQPGSGISREDEVPILRFLHQYSMDQLKRRQGGGDGG
jgi:hypothetical protein